MEEKERYKVSVGSDYITICDYEENRIKALDNCGMQSLLNLQDKRIKELKEENQQLIKALNGEVFINYKLPMENAQLKQQLHDLPKKIVGEIRDVAGEYWDFNICKECGNVPVLNTLTTKDFDEILDIILKKYGEEDE